MAAGPSRTPWPPPDALLAAGLQAIVVDWAGRIAGATPRMDEVFAGPGNSLVSRLFDSLFSLRNPPWLSSQIRKRAAECSWTGDVVLRKCDNSECWAHLQAHRLPDATPSAVRLLVIVEDVTERVELADMLLRRAQELYDRNWELELIGRIGRLLLANTDLESALNGVLREVVRSVRADGGLIFVKDRHTDRLVCRAVCGATAPRSLLGFSVGPEEACLTTETVRTRTTQMAPDVTKDPRVAQQLAAGCRVRSLLSVPITAGDKSFGALLVGRHRVGLFADEEVRLVEVITNHAAFAIYNSFLGEDVALSRAYWQRTFDAIDDLLAVVDRDGTIVRVNEPLARLLGRSAPELVGEECSMLHDKLDPKAVRELADAGRPVFFGDQEFCGEICEASAFPLTDASGRVEAIVFHGKIKTSERRLHDEFRRASRLASVGELLAGAAHSFGNVLTAIKCTLGSARSALRDSAGPQDPGRRIDDALEHAARGSEIVRRLLNFSRGTEEPPSAVSLAEVVDAALALSTAHPAAKQRTITNLVPRDLPHVQANQGPLQEVVLNLLLNALQATEPGGEVRIEAEARPEDGIVCLRVSDNGPGIPAHLIDRIFEPFFSTKGGTGLGLATSAAAVHRMGGTITVDSEPGKGAVFTVRLNLRDPHAARQADAA